MEGKRDGVSRKEGERAGNEGLLKKFFIFIFNLIPSGRGAF